MIIKIMQTMIVNNISAHITSIAPVILQYCTIQFRAVPTVKRVLTMTGGAVAYDIYTDKCRHRITIIFCLTNKTNSIKSIVKKLIENDSRLFFGNCFPQFCPINTITNFGNVNSIIMCIWAKVIIVVCTM